MPTQNNLLYSRPAHSWDAHADVLQGDDEGPV